MGSCFSCVWYTNDGNGDNIVDTMKLNLGSGFNSSNSNKVFGVMCDDDLVKEI